MFGLAMPPLTSNQVSAGDRALLDVLRLIPLVDNSNILWYNINTMKREKEIKNEVPH